MRSPLLRASLAAAFAASALAAPSPASTVVPSGAADQVRAAGGTIVFSAWDPADARWHLSLRERGAAPRRLPVAPSRVSFDADIGTDSAGAPELIYRRCSGTESAPTGCELFVLSLASGATERPVRNANDASRNDMTPTLWRGRIAWSRIYGTTAEPDPVVYTKLLTAPRSQPSRRLPGVPQVRCAQELGLVEPPCGPTTHRWVGALELWGDRLGLIVGYLFEGLGGQSQAEVRLDAVAAGTSREITFLTSGLAGQFLSGPSFTDGRLAWYRGCWDRSEPTCRPFVGPWRYRISTATYLRGAPGEIRVLGFADTGTRLYEALGCDIYGDPRTTPMTCRIDSLAPPAYSAAPAPELATATPPTR